MNNPDQKIADLASSISKALTEQAMPAYVDRKRVFANELFIDFKAYQKAGFTDGQALHLICTRTLP